MSIFVQNFVKRWFRSKFLKNFDIGKIFENIYFGQHFCKVPILVQIFINFEFGLFWLNLRKMLILVKELKNVDICQNFRKSRFWSKFSKFRFWSELMRISILVKISSLINIFGEISILVNFLRDLDFSKKITKILVWVKISEKCRFG